MCELVHMAYTPRRVNTCMYARCVHGVCVPWNHVVCLETFDKLGQLSRLQGRCVICFRHFEATNEHVIAGCNQRHTSNRCKTRLRLLARIVDQIDEKSWVSSPTLALRGRRSEVLAHLAHRVGSWACLGERTVEQGGGPTIVADRGQARPSSV